MKILVVVEKLPPAGGAEKAAWDVANKYVKTDEVHYLCFGKKNETYTKNGIKIYCIKRPKKPFLYSLLWGKIKIKRLIKKINPDFIHVHMITVLSFIIKDLKTPKMLTFQSSPMEHYSYIKRKEIYIFNKCFKQFDCVTTVSTYMQKYCTERFKREIVFIPNAVDLDVFYSDEKPKDEKLIFYAGRVRESKNMQVFFDLAKIMPDYTFKIAGSGKLVNAINLPNTEFLGNLSPTELQKWYSKAKFCVFPSTFENFPLVGLEAAACGSIVIAQAKGFKEYIKNNYNGLIIDNMTAQKVKKAITNFTNYENIQKNSLDTAKQYSVKKISKMYLDKIKETFNA